MKLVGLLLAVTLPWLGACRIGFDEHALQDAGNQGSDAPPDAPLPILACGAPLSFEVAVPSQSATATGISFSAVATDTAYYVLALDDTGEVHGYSYPFSGDQVVVGTIDASVLTDGVQSVAAISIPEGLLAVAEYGTPMMGMSGSADGTVLIPLDADLGARAPQQRTPGWFTIDAALARASDGALSLLGQMSNSDVVTKLVSPAGVTLGAAHKVVDGTDNITLPTIGPGGAGFSVSWSSAAVSPRVVRVALLDAQLGTLAPPLDAPQVMNTRRAASGFDGLMPHVAYAPERDLYLVTWYEKPGTDTVWVSLRDGHLDEIATVQLSANGTLPQVAAGKDDFLVVWREGNSSGSLAAARVDFQGNVSSLTVDGTANRSLVFDVTSRAGQPVVVWLDSTDAAGPLHLHIDPLCN